ncbi:MAG: hypothetical protein EBU82_06190 [Flavobacteriia bacterium]|nr:hypothetical protein [Flavobacteriia bacterium]
MLPDIRNYTNTNLYLPILAASSIVDTAGLFVWRYTSKPNSPINKWYDRFGLSAYTADVLSIALGVVLTQLVTSWMGGAWNPWVFCGMAVVVQMAHDLFFGNVIVPMIPKGHNSIMDLMKEYVKIKNPGGILIVDAIYMIVASLLTMTFASMSPFSSWFALLWTIYITMYVLYTRPV